MDVEARKKIVAKLLSAAKEATQKEAEIIKKRKTANMSLFSNMRAYVLSKFLLHRTARKRISKGWQHWSLAKTMKLDKNVIHDLDTATPCDHATSESTKKVLLFFVYGAERYGIESGSEGISEYRPWRSWRSMYWKQGKKVIQENA